MLPVYIVPTLILLVALITDVKTRKIPNKWVLISCVLAIISSFYFFEMEGIKQGAVGAGVALLMTLPLVLLGALGAGDMKLMFAFGLATNYSTTFAVLVLSFFWAVAIGLGIAFYKGRGRKLLNNTFKILTSQKPELESLERIPYTIALMAGWITFVLLGLKQGALL
jgi:Flp pilus assembly protein protease CpaA